MLFHAVTHSTNSFNNLHSHSCNIISYYKTYLALCNGMVEGGRRFAGTGTPHPGVHPAPREYDATVCVGRKIKRSFLGSGYWVL